MTKTCFKCKLVKEVSHFYKHVEMADGYLGKCKECTKNAVKLNRKNKLEQYSKYDQSRQKSPIRRALNLEYQRKHRLTNPIKYKARNALNNAIRDGKIINPGCRICGEQAQAHHHDYTKPLEVDWLCFKHHRELGHNQTVVHGNQKRKSKRR